MILVKNTQIVADIKEAVAQKTKRIVAVEAGTWEKTLDIFERNPETMNPSNLAKIANHFGYDVVITFEKQDEKRG